MKLYRELAWIYAEAYKKIFPYEKQAKLLDKIFKKYKVRKVLEVACGAGHLAKFLKDKGYDIIASDISKELIKIAKNLYPQIKFLEADMRKLRFRERFDAIICLGRSFSLKLFPFPYSRISSPWH
jgi:ubiquinone/menaquinone biosynthesis C-methylase UbiE